MIVLLTFPILRDVFQGQNKRITYPEIVIQKKARKSGLSKLNLQQKLFLRLLLLQVLLHIVHIHKFYIFWRFKDVFSDFVIRFEYCCCH